VRSYLDLLRRPATRTLLIGQGIGRLTPGMILLSIILALREGGYDYAMVGLVTGAHQLGVALGSPLQGRAADLLGHRRVLLPDGIVYLVGTVVLTLGIASRWSVPALIAVAATTGLASPPMTACARAALGAMFGSGREREQAFILTSANVDVGYLVGPLATVAIATAFGAGAAVITAGASVLVGAIVYASGPSVDATGPRSVVAGEPRWRVGSTGAMRSPGLRAIAFVYFSVATTYGAFDLFVASVAEEAGRTSRAGALMSILASASLVSAFAYGARVWKGTLRVRMRTALLLFAGFIALYPFLTASYLLLVVAVIATGLMIGPMNICGFQLIDDVSPPRARAEAQSWTQSAVYLGSAVGGALAGVIIDLFGPRATMSVGVVGASVAALVLHRSHALRATDHATPRGSAPASTLAPAAEPLSPPAG
jgi:MFS family permease